jgi:hypothetical protein
MAQHCVVPGCGKVIPHDRDKPTCAKHIGAPRPRDPGEVVHTPAHELGPQVSMTGQTRREQQEAKKLAEKLDTVTDQAFAETEDVLRKHNTEEGRLEDKAERLEASLGDAYVDPKTRREREQSRDKAAETAADRPAPAPKPDVKAADAPKVDPKPKTPADEAKTPRP